MTPSDSAEGLPQSSGTGGISRSSTPGLAGAATGLLTYTLFAVLDFVEIHEGRQECGFLRVECARGMMFFLLAVYGTPLLAIAAGLLALFRRTRLFAGGLAIGVAVGLLALGVWLAGP